MFVEFTVDLPTGGAPVVHLTFEPEESLTTVVDALALADNTGPDARVWIHGTTDARRRTLESRGMVSDRTLLQMRRSLPAAPTDLSTAALTDEDVNDFIAVNNRAFHWHPEQSGLTRDAFEVDRQQPWFRTDGFRIHRVSGALAAFCWTKIHSEPEPLGEIYVIAVDPSFHGRGLGKAMTLAGLDWLAQQGLDTAMLYVESDNESAVATYRKIGFEIHRSDTLWHRP